MGTQGPSINFDNPTQPELYTIINTQRGDKTTFLPHPYHANFLKFLPRYDDDWFSLVHEPEFGKNAYRLVNVRKNRDGEPRQNLCIKESTSPCVKLTVCEDQDPDRLFELEVLEGELPEKDSDGTNEPVPKPDETNQPETNQPETNQPETNQPETNQPETNQPETNQPETNQPDSEKPDEKDEPPKIGDDAKGSRVDAATDVVGSSSAFDNSLKPVGERDNVNLTIQEIIRLYALSKKIYTSAMEEHLDKVYQKHDTNKNQSLDREESLNYLFDVLSIRDQRKELALARAAVDITSGENDTISKDEMETLLFDMITGKLDSSEYAREPDFGVNIKLKKE